MLLDDLQKLVEQNLSSICSNLQILKSQKKLLLDNADKVKATIKEAAETQMNLLKMKERQLIRQIEFVTAHQNSLIDAQIANILLSKGSLMTSQDILSKCHPDEKETLLKISDCTHVNVKPVPPLKMVYVQIETNQLTSAIENFGQAHLPDSIMHHHSSVVPARIEDYGDSDQVVLHKSIHMNSNSYSPSDEGSPFTINVKFPKIPHNSWLASSQTKAQPQLSTLSPSKGVSSWLADLRVSEEKDDEKIWIQNKAEEDGNPGIKFLEGSTPQSICTKSCGSSSIEIVNPAEFKEYFRHSTFYDGAHLWKEAPAAKELLTNPAIEDICQANELCNSCNDCVCQGYCESLAKEKALQTSKWLEKSHFQKLPDSQINFFPHLFANAPQSGQKSQVDSKDAFDLVVKHMADILNSDDKDWLSKPNEDKQLPTTSTIFTAPSLEKCWLYKGLGLNSSENIIQEGVRASSDSKTWLLRDLCNDHKPFINKIDLEKPQEDKGKEEKDNKNIESKNNFVSILELKDALNELPAERKSLDKSHCFYNPDASIHNKDAESDYEKKFKWLLNSLDASRPPTPSCYYKVSPKICSSDFLAKKSNKWLLAQI